MNWTYNWTYIWGAVTVLAIIVGLVVGVNQICSWFPWCKPVVLDSFLVPNSMMDVRKQNKVQQLLEIQDRKKLSELEGVFGFAAPWSLNNKLDRVESLTLGRDRGGTSQVEIHKTSQGNIYVFVYLAQNDLSRLTDPSRKNTLTIVAYFEKHKEYSHLVGIPSSRLIKWQRRSNLVDIESR